MNDWSDYDRYVRDALPGWHCPGVAVAVVRGDEVLYREAHGLRDVERQRPMTPDTRFAMASVTKSFTAMSVALLVDDGLLGWDRPVREVVPDLILHDPVATAQLTPRDMLSHRTGLPRHDLAAWRLDLPRAIDDQVARSHAGGEATSANLTDPRSVGSAFTAASHYMYDRE